MEKKTAFRNFYYHKVLRRHICEKYFNIDPVLVFYANRWLLLQKRTHKWIADKIESGEPFMIARFGNTELSVITSVIKQRLFGNIPSVEERFSEWFKNLVELSGFFPNEPQLANDFTDLMLEYSKEVDLLAIWYCEMDDYVITEYMKDCKLTYLNYIEPWRVEKPWTAALKGKKVQTIAGEKDERFATWFDALEYMSQEAMKMDFDVAIIGCGAYGFPLAAKLKKAGKQAIHFGGATQIMFGIKGRRWVDNPRSQVKFNDAWEYPKKEETPQNSVVVENNCYW